MHSLKLFDANLYIGSWPFHTLRHNDRNGVLRLMKKAGVKQGMVSSLQSVFCFYRDLKEINAWLFHEIKDDLDVFHPFYTLNPLAPDAAGEAERLKLERHMAGVRLYPSYHQYALNGAKTHALLDSIADWPIPVYLAYRFEDERVHHPKAVVHPVPLDELAAAINRYPQMTWIVGGIRISEVQELFRMTDHRRVYIEMSFIQTPFLALEKLVDIAGADRVLFGSGLPYWYPECSILKLTHAKLPEDELALIAYRNAEAILRQKHQ